MKKTRKRNQGSILTLAIIGAGIGILIVGTLLNLAVQDLSSTEKEIGHAKSNQSLKLSHLIYTESEKNSTSTLTQSQKSDLSNLIGGEGSKSNSIFGKTSSIPGFNQFGVVWDGLGAGALTKITSTHKSGNNTNDGPSTFREGSKAVLSVKNETPAVTPTVSFFERLIFYDGDLEIIPQDKRTTLMGNIYSKGDIYLDSTIAGKSKSLANPYDRIIFYAPEDTSILTTPNKIFRRGRNGQTLWHYAEAPITHSASSFFYAGGTNNRNLGLFFATLKPTHFNNLVGTNGNYNHNSSYVFKDHLTSVFTNYEDAPSDSDTNAEYERRSFSGDGTNQLGYMYTGADFNSPTTKFDTTSTSVLIKFNNTSNAVTNFSKNMAPYQLIEDIQFKDTPDIITHIAQNGPYKDTAGNSLPTDYEDPNSGVLKETAMNAIAALVIRDGVAYYRTQPNGALTKVLGKAGIEGLYPDDTYTGAKAYGDLRWYGHFGQNNSPVIPASPSNPDRWHFPIRSVTFNKTIDTQNTTVTGTSSTEGTAVGFTFRIDKHDPVTDGASGSATWIRKDIDLSGITGYPNQAAMTVVSNATATTDPVRTAYNIVKAEVRKLYNAHHIYTSRHNGAIMLNRDGTTPTVPAVPRPDVWGNVLGNNPPAINPVNYDTRLTQANPNPAANDYSAFWNDDGAAIINGGNAVDRLYTFTSNSIARDGQLAPSSLADTTPRVELFPIWHNSLFNIPASPSAGQNIHQWYIYKSTLPFSDRTLRMPFGIFPTTGGFQNACVGADYVKGLDYLPRMNAPFTFNVSYLNNSEARPGSGSETIYARMENFGYAGATNGGRQPSSGSGTGVYGNSGAPNPRFHNWYTLLNNAPEMLARLEEGGNNQKTFEINFAYNASDTGGYYGIDNLCMIDHQEKKIVVFTEIDLAELTQECFRFNDLPYTFEGTDTRTSPTGPQKVIYVVNTTMGNNFFGKRVHCGAVRIVRGHMLAHPLTIATPNALHIWGDFNCPGYKHRSASSGNNNNPTMPFNYTVPTTKEHDAGRIYTSQPVALYADTIHTYGNNWIPFRQTGSSPRTLYDNNGGTLSDTWWSATITENAIFTDTQLWWEDDGLRTLVPYASSIPSSTDYDAGQRFLNYHALIFNTASSYYNQYTDIKQKQTIFKHLAQGIYAGLVYGNVESRLPSMFAASDVTAIPITKPNSSVKQLDWMMSWIPRSKWKPLDRAQLIALTSSAGSEIPSGNEGATGFLKLGSYYGADFPGSLSHQFEECKIKFSGGGFGSDIRCHTNESYVEVASSQQLAKNIRGSFVCLFNSRQSTHGWNPTIVGAKKPELYYSYEPTLATTAIPPGTPSTGGSTSSTGTTKYFIEGTRWDY
jgi:hypothetical protein